MSRLIQSGSVATACVLLAACAQVIGLSKYDEVESPPASTGGHGGSGAHGAEAGANEAGQGTTSGTGGKGGSGAQGGSSGCSETIEVSVNGTPSTDPMPDFGYYSYEYNVDPQIDTAASDYFWIDFYTGGEYTGEDTGTFELGQGEDSNYASCSRCVWLGVDVGDSGTAKTYFFAKSGTMNVAADSEQMNGLPDVHLDDVLLSEVELDSDTHVSTEIPGGRCLHVSNVALVIASSAPAAWKCPDYAYGTNDGCDCGCGALDPDCDSDLVGACDYCNDEGSCAFDCSDIKLSDNAVCGPPSQGWTCDAQSYGDGTICDCGCGIVDHDCAGPQASQCDLCDDPKSCTASKSGTCSDISASDNSKCK